MCNWARGHTPLLYSGAALVCHHILVMLLSQLCSPLVHVWFGTLPPFTNSWFNLALMKEQNNHSLLEINWPYTKRAHVAQDGELTNLWGECVSNSHSRYACTICLMCMHNMHDICAQHVLHAFTMSVHNMPIYILIATDLRAQYA